MFTGIVEEQGKIKNILPQGNGYRMEIDAEKVLEDVHRGDSIAVNGVCLTVVDIFSHGFAVDMLHVTKERSGLGDKVPGSIVNLERALLPTTRLGGHILQGHVDTMGTILLRREEPPFTVFRFSYPKEFDALTVLRGSIGINGVSLTLSDVGRGEGEVSIIPETLRETNLSTLYPGDQVTLEFDILGKYLYRQRQLDQGTIDAQFLMNNGY